MKSSIVISAISQAQIISETNKYIQQGWKPEGSVTSTVTTGDFGSIVEYYQTMVKGTEEYQIVRAKDISELIRLVTKLMREGWISKGGVSYDGKDYIQAMTKD